jgi:hypothetical protein
MTLPSPADLLAALNYALTVGLAVAILFLAAAGAICLLEWRSR